MTEEVREDSVEPSPNEVQERIRRFYENEGWRTKGGITHDACLNEDLRPVAEDYVSKSRLRILRHLPSGGGKILDVASGPIQYSEYLEYSRGFRERHCVDLSQRALNQAKEKLGDHGRYHCGDLLELDLDDNFDAVISLHTIYHIHRDRQEEAVRKLLDCCCPRAPLVIVYSNPDNLMDRMVTVLKRILKKERGPSSDHDFYVHSHPLVWWKRFAQDGEVEFFPWRSLSSRHQKAFLPDNGFGRFLFRWLYRMEETFPTFFVRHMKYYTVVLRKREDLGAGL